MKGKNALMYARKAEEFLRHKFDETKSTCECLKVRSALKKNQIIYEYLQLTTMTSTISLG